MFKCPQCDKKEYWEKLLKTHIELDHGQKPHKCTQCEEDFDLKEQLENHTESNHEQINCQNQCYSCDKCFFIFESEDKFTKHLTGLQHNSKRIDSEYDDSEESEDKDYSDKGRLCGRVFTTYDTFDNHQDSYLHCEKFNVCFHNT